jgi:hypothetical protein
VLNQANSVLEGRFWAKQGQFCARLGRFWGEQGQFGSKQSPFWAEQGQFGADQGQFEAKQGQFGAKQGLFWASLCNFFNCFHLFRAIFAVKDLPSTVDLASVA